jgi:hypothetical protein
MRITRCKHPQQFVCACGQKYEVDVIVSVREDGTQRIHLSLTPWHVDRYTVRYDEPIEFIVELYDTRRDVR